ncbi:hypothetical protein MAMC_00418 [Methylacidimicrobium cyclopophantes]|uniref:DUF1318 domain-containing protein n=1 Tax=Methylacidimicrobium cyclopophantes TaxID=1041766 RepID=A0A5E6M744_9BACT|nr:DUF1318 domain-containing protein [Methylacidimicrobium cyclopophantes]VVM05131.1 hypothetical protein MAMC_00418 [Methylacidimicrobium cyclopophantes]
MRVGKMLFLVCSVAALGSCAQVRLSSPNPLLFDVDVDTEIRSPPLQSRDGAAAANLQQKRRIHMSEVQALKNAHIVGETRNGYLQILKEPEESVYRSYVDRIVEEENRARYLLYSTEAKKEEKSLTRIEARYGERWRDDAFPGEYVQQPDGSWAKKEDPGQEAARPADTHRRASGG